MNQRVSELREEIADLEEEEIEVFLIENSGLPDPQRLAPPEEGPEQARLDLALMHAAAEQAPMHLFQNWVRRGAKEAPNNAPHIAPVVAGTIGLGRLIAEGEERHVGTLRSLSSDSRWRVREAVAMALHRVGQEDPDHLIQIAEEWSKGSPLEQRGAVAGLAKPGLLDGEDRARRALDLLDDLTEALQQARTHDDEGLIALRKALGVAWSVVVQAIPREGRARFEAWLAVEDPDVRWVLEENLKQRPMREVDPEWVEQTLDRLQGSARRRGD